MQMCNWRGFVFSSSDMLSLLNQANNGKSELGKQKRAYC